MINFISATPIEHELYCLNPKISELCDSVGQMIMDLHDEEFHLDIILALNDADNLDEFTLAFSGTTMAMDFYPQRIDITDFNLANGEEDEVLATFPRDNVNAATVWLVNQIISSE